MKSKTLRRGWLLVAFGLLAASCAQASETPTVPAAPTTIPATSTTIPATSTTIPATSTTIPATSTTIPATSTADGWTTYSDETARFSISYPDDWEIFTLNEAATAEFLDNIMQALDVTVEPVIVFAVGLPLRGGGFEPNITIVVERISADMGLEAYVAGSIQGLEEAFPSYTSTEQVSAVVRDRDSVLVHGSYDLADLLPGVAGRWSMIQLLAIEGPAGWSVSCGTSESTASALATDLELCDSVVRTFELSGS